MSTAVDTETAKAQLLKVNEDLDALKAQMGKLKEAGKMDELKALFPKMVRKTQLGPISRGLTLLYRQFSSSGQGQVA